MVLFSTVSALVLTKSELISLILIVLIALLAILSQLQPAMTEYMPVKQLMQPVLELFISYHQQVISPPHLYGFGRFKAWLLSALHDLSAHATAFLRLWLRWTAKHVKYQKVKVQLQVTSLLCHQLVRHRIPVHFHGFQRLMAVQMPPQ